VAVKANLRGVAADQLPKLRLVLLKGWIFILPLALLIYCLFIIFLSPSKSAIIAIAALIIVSFAQRQHWFTFSRLVATLDDTGRILVEIGVIGAVASLIVAVVSLTGLGLVFSQVLLSASGGSLPLLLVMTAAASIILGMSMPVTASYIILAVLAAPALVQAHVPEMAAHLFIFYFAILSFVTPPVCVAVYIASTIAKAKPMESAFHAMKLAIVAYVVPFVFVADGALLMDAGPLAIVLAVASNIIGFVGLGVALQGYFTVKVQPWLRALLGVAGVACVTTILPAKAVGMVVVVAFVAWQWRTARIERSNNTAAATRQRV
jgi:TRAP transporter 4TM/12TM fusion protein